MAARTARGGPVVARLLAIFAVTLPVSSQAEPGVLQLVSQTREVSVEVETVEYYFESCLPLLDPYCDPDSTTSASFPDRDAAAGPGPFVSTASRAEFPNTFATQVSDIMSSSIRAAGSHQAGSSFWNSGGFPITFHSESHDTDTRALVTFELDAASAYVLSGSATTSGLMFSGSSARIRLIGADDEILAEVEVSSDPGCVDEDCLTVGPELLEASGCLQAGTYTVEAIASGHTGGVHSTSGSFGSFQGGEFELELQLSASVPLLPGVFKGLLALALLATALRGRWLS